MVLRGGVVFSVQRRPVLLAVFVVLSVYLLGSCSLASNRYQFIEFNYTRAYRDVQTLVDFGSRLTGMLSL
jgi:muramidase (phage lysozyme)